MPKMKAVHYMKPGGGVACGIDAIKARAHSLLDRKWERVTCKRCLHYRIPAGVNSGFNAEEKS